MLENTLSTRLPDDKPMTSKAGKVVSWNMRGRFKELFRKKTFLPRLLFRREVIALILLTMLFLLGIQVWQDVFHPDLLVAHRIKDTKFEHAHVVKELIDLRSKLQQAMIRNTTPTRKMLTDIEQLILFVDPRFNLDVKQTYSPDVCPEVYHGPFEGWLMENCTYSRPLSELLSVALYYQICNESRLASVLQGIHDTHPKLQVLFAVDSKDQAACVKVVAKFTNVKTVEVKLGWPGDVWNTLVSYISTPYVLVGRHLDSYSRDVSIERQIRVLGAVRHVEVVGGAVRNESGHWRVGCFQFTMSNYALVYQDGYFRSRNECMFCDHLLGPFVTRTKTVKVVPFSRHLRVDVLFEDWFLRLKNKKMQVMNCPDAMYFATDPHMIDKEISAELWIPLARKWALNRLSWRGVSAHLFSCEDVNISCYPYGVFADSLLFPPCCLDELAQGLGFLHEFFLSQKLPYEVYSGSVLGAVKMADIIPWDLDADIIFQRKKFGKIINAKKLFERHGYRIVEVGGKDKLLFYTPNMYIEMYPSSSLQRSVFPNISSKLNIRGMWFFGPRNPGLYARNRYGPEMLRHAQSWLTLFKKSSWDLYKPGHFKPCASQTNHACLDKFPTDGNLGFKDTIKDDIV